MADNISNGDLEREKEIVNSKGIKEKGTITIKDNIIIDNLGAGIEMFNTGDVNINISGGEISGNMGDAILINENGVIDDKNSLCIFLDISTIFSFRSTLEQYFNDLDRAYKSEEDCHWCVMFNSFLTFLPGNRYINLKNIDTRDLHLFMCNSMKVLQDIGIEKLIEIININPNSPFDCDRT